MTKRSRKNSGTETSPSTEGSLDAAAVAGLLDLAARADDAELDQVVADVAEVKVELDAVQTDVQELKEVVAAGGASGDPTPAALPAASSSAGSVTPVLVNGQPATPEQHRAALEALRTGNGRHVR